MKLLKTLNGALGDNALPEAHIDEAFDVWWPKLESQLKALPPEESKTETHRPDRELLEEILALVRNQSRPLDLTTIPAPPALKPPFEMSSGNYVFERVDAAARKHGLRIAKLMRVVPEKPENRKYVLEVESGPVIAVEMPPGSVVLAAKRLVAELESSLKLPGTKET